MSLQDVDPTFDSDGYPTEATLAALRSLEDVDNPWEATDAACDFMARGWRWRESSVVRRPEGIWVFATGGWSGNEDLMGAFMRSLLYRYWVSWRSIELSGGLYVIPCTPEGADIVDTAESVITYWAWGHIPTAALTALLPSSENGEELRRERQC